MVKKSRSRRIFSVSGELLTKSQEAALAAVQIFNNPLVQFKSEIFIVLMNIAWTYLLHAYFRKERIEYRYFKRINKNRQFYRTASGAKKHLDLKQSLKLLHHLIDNNTTNNLLFLSGIRDEIEHQMTSRIDTSLTAKFQACCLNYNEYVKKFFGNKYGIDKHLTFSLQFSSISHEQLKTLPSSDKMPSHIKAFIQKFENNLSEKEFNDPKFSYRILCTAKLVNNKGQADEVIEFVPSNSELAQSLNNKAYMTVKETERNKHLPGEIVEMMQNEGYLEFKMHVHTNLWKKLDAQNNTKFGAKVAKTWYWYDSWVERVRAYCVETYGTKK